MLIRCSARQYHLSKGNYLHHLRGFTKCFVKGVSQPIMSRSARICCPATCTQMARVSKSGAHGCCGIRVGGMHGKTAGLE